MNEAVGKNEKRIRQSKAACVEWNMRSTHETPNVSASAAREWRASVEGRTRERPPGSSVKRVRGGVRRWAVRHVNWQTDAAG